MRGSSIGGCSIRPSRWVPLICALAGCYLLLLYRSQLLADRRFPRMQWPKGAKLKSDYDYGGGAHEPATVKKFTLTLNSTLYEAMEIEDVLTDSNGESFEQRLSADVDFKAPVKLILSWDAGHGPENLRGCPDWHCEFTYNRSLADKASVVLTTTNSFVRRNPDQLVTFYSQESPRNMPMAVDVPDYFNVSLGYRRDTAGASPYGYTVKLARPRDLTKVVNASRLAGKTRAAAWFVSHCTTNSRREDIVEAMKKYVPVDIYGHCLGGATCPRGGSCENALDEDYHFYLAFENSICTDYITEKVWNQGYGRDIVPIVLKRSIAANRLPPGSFLAVDDYRTVQELAERMHYLMGNQTAYREMFAWRRDYATIYLNGELHDILERPWGFCQLCRLAWQRERRHHTIPDFKKWWDGSCEADGTLAAAILSETMARENREGAATAKTRTRGPRPRPSSTVAPRP